MKIAIIGYGKMGKTILPLAEKRGHQVVAKTTSAEEMQKIKGADVAIDFSVPNAALDNMKFCREHNIPLVVGTTGWYDSLEKVTAATQSQQHKLLWASNFSVGVNLFFALNQKLAQLMNGQPYEASMEETHHTEKLDAPSGTAISLANDIIARNDAYEKWTCYEEDLGQMIPTNDTPNLGILSKRIPGVTGTHKIFYHSDIDTIEVTHQAHNRKGFALGSVIAAEWLYENQNSGVYTMADVLKL